MAVVNGIYIWRDLLAINANVILYNVTKTVHIIDAKTVFTDAKAI